LYDAEVWTLRKEHHKYVGSFEIYSWRRMEIRWTDRVRKEVLCRVKEERKRRKPDWIGYILRSNCFLKHAEGEI
jgi:hypothetical protein